MFLRDLSADEKKTFLLLARQMIAADEVEAPEELAMLADAAAEMEVPLDSGASQLPVQALCATVESPRARATMLLELASLAHIDDDYSNQERDLLREIGDHWNVTPLELVRIEAWAETRIQMARDAAEIIHEISSLSR